MAYVIQTNYGRFMALDTVIGWHTTRLAKATRFATPDEAKEALVKIPFSGRAPREPSFAVLAEDDVQGIRAFYHACWTTLVRFAGAIDRDTDRRSFVDAFTKPSTVEYRFMGELGFGGKFWRNADRFYVSCYREDETPKRRELIEYINKLIEVNASLCFPGP